MSYIKELRNLIGHKRINLSGCIVIIENGNGQFLLQQRKYPYGKWGLPGGLMELGESTEETARREVFEETGLSIGKLTLLGVYSGENYLCIAENGDEFYTVITAYVTSDYTGVLSVHDDESISFDWFDCKTLPDNFAKTHRYIINDYLGIA